MASWTGFEAEAGEMAEAGRRVLVGNDGVAIAFLATAGASARPTPHLAPVCPIFAGDGLYVSAAGRSPKVYDLREGGGFALHAFLGANDEEFQVAGRAIEVDDPDERARVHEAIAFPAFDREDPIFRFDIRRALWVYWERVGQPDTKAVRRRWAEGGMGRAS